MGFLPIYSTVLITLMTLINSELFHFVAFILGTLLFCTIVGVAVWFAFRMD
jgi:hypothetical protein